MTKYTPLIRVFLTFLCAGLAASIAVVDSETFRIVAGILVTAFGAVGIVPPHVPTVTAVAPRDAPVNVVRAEDGQALVAVLVAILVAALVWWLCVALGLPSIVGIIAAILVLLAGVQHTRRF